MQIYVRRDAINWLRCEGELSGEVERGGILVGQVYNSPREGQRIVEISGMIIGKHTVSSVSELRYTFETWRGRSSALMREKFPGRRIVGWYNTHLVALPSKPEKEGAPIEKTSLFFSRDDLFLHECFFPDPWYVAVVLNADGGSLIVGWKNNAVVPCTGYRVFDDTRIAL